MKRLRIDNIGYCAEKVKELEAERMKMKEEGKDISEITFKIDSIMHTISGMKEIYL